MSVSTRPPEPVALMFGDDGSIPTIRACRAGPIGRHRSLSRAERGARRREHVWRKRLGDMWRNGIFPYATITP